MVSFACAALAFGCAPASSSPEAESPPSSPAPASQDAPSATSASGDATATTPAAAPPAHEPMTLTVPIEAKSGSKLYGFASFTEVDGGVKVSIGIEGVSPGEHGAHVHEKGDCSSPDGKSAGGHFNPASHDHALPATAVRHLGDLGNIKIAADGTGTLEIVVPGANLLAKDPSSYLGRAIVIHAQRDDGGQPVGNAGDRIGCGVINQPL